MAGKLHQLGFARLEAYGLQRVLDHVIDGKTLNVIAALPGIEMSRPMLNSWLLGKFCGTNPAAIKKGQERRALYQEARRMSAASIAEDGIELLDAENDPRMAQLVTSRANFRLRLAEVYDRERFGQAKQQIQVDIAVTHLDALRKRTIVRAAVTPALESGEPDVEVIGDAQQYPSEDM